jgi:hypothetical protein
LGCPPLTEWPFGGACRLSLARSGRNRRRARRRLAERPTWRGGSPRGALIPNTRHRRRTVCGPRQFQDDGFFRFLVDPHAQGRQIPQKHAGVRLGPSQSPPQPFWRQRDQSRGSGAARPKVRGRAAIAVARESAAQRCTANGTKVCFARRQTKGKIGPEQG